MNCNSFEALIALYAEGDIDPSRTKNVESHLQSCPSCQRFLIELEASQAMVKELATESLDSASFNVVRQRVMQQVNRRQAARPTWWRFLSPALAEWRPAWVAALAVLIALGFLLQWQLWHRPTGSDRADSPTVASAPTVREKHSRAPAPKPPEKMTLIPEQSSKPGLKQFAQGNRTSVAREVVLPVGIEPDEESEPPVEQGSNLEPEALPPADITPEPPPPLVIKLVTDDPNLVIVWLVDQDVQHN